MLAETINDSFYLITILLVLAKTKMVFGLVILHVIVLALKTSVRKPRPNGTDNLSFPSGHSATAWFIAASYDYNPLIVAWATAAAASRVALKWHDYTDVCVGAALGIIVAEVTR